MGKPALIRAFCWNDTCHPGSAHTVRKTVFTAKTAGACGQLGMKGLLKIQALIPGRARGNPGLIIFDPAFCGPFCGSVSTPKPALREHLLRVQVQGMTLYPLFLIPLQLTELDWSEFCSVLNASQGGTLQKLSKKQVFSL